MPLKQRRTRPKAAEDAAWPFPAPRAKSADPRNWWKLACLFMAAALGAVLCVLYLAYDHGVLFGDAWKMVDCPRTLEVVPRDVWRRVRNQRTCCLDARRGRRNRA